MKSLSNIPSSQFMSSNKGQLVRSCLPILGTGLLVILVSGGFPPATWVLLVKTLSQLNQLLVSQGPGVILVLIILIVQSLLLAAAWGLLGWVVMREGAYFMTIQSKAELDRLLAFQSSTGELITPSQMLTRRLSAVPPLGVEQEYGVATDQLEDEQEYGVTTDQLEDEQDYGVATDEQEYGVTTGPLRRGGDFAVTTGPLGVKTALLREEEPEEEASWVSRGIQSRNAQPSSVQSRSIQSPSIQSRNAHSSNVQSSSVQSHRTTNLQRGLATGRLREEDLLENPSSSAQSPRTTNLRRGTGRLREEDLLENPSSSVQSRRTTNLRRGTGRLREEALLENPFDKEVPPDSETALDVERGRVRVVVEEEEQPEEEEEEDDSPFVFGNPFDGPLPEVFRYDTELRRSVMELTEEEDSKSNGSKAKGSGSQKTRRL